MPGSTPSRSSRNCYVSLIPMSERQQLKLVRQLETCDNREANSGSVKESTTPHRPRSRSCNGRGETPLHKAAIKGDEELVIKLLEEGADPNIPDFAGWTPLHEACNHGWYGVALALVQAGASVNARGFDDDTPLHDAAINGHSKLVRLLVESGADVYSRNKGGKTPCDVAAPGLMPHLLKSHSSENIELGRKKSDVSSGSAQADNTAISEMRRTPPQTKVDKSPRVTLRLHQIKKKSGKVNSEGTAYDSNKFQFSVNMEEKGSKEDVYEFKSSKEATPVRGNSTSPEVDKNNSDAKSEKSGENFPGGAESESAPVKRNISEVTDNDEAEDDNKKKKRKEADGKDANNSKSVTAAGRLAAVRNVGNNSEKPGKVGGHVVNKNSAVASKTVISGSGGSVSNDRKSPSSPKGGAAGSNPNAPSSSIPKADSEEDKTSPDGEKVDPGPKVPPLKIVIPQQTGTEPEPGNRNGKSSASRHHPALPYVVSSNSNDSEKDGPRSRSVSPTDSLKADEKKDPAIGMLSAEDQKGSLHHQRVLRSSHRSGPGSNGESRSSDSVPAPKNNGNGQGSSSNSGTAVAVVTSSNTNPSNSSTTASVDNPSPQNSNQSSPTPQSEGNPSNTSNPPPTSNENPSNPSNNPNFKSNSISHVSNNNNSNSNNNNNGNKPSNAPSNASSNSSSNNEEKTAENNSESAATSPQQSTSNPAPVELHPRKRKLKHNKEVKEPPPAQVTSETNESANTSTEIHPHDQPVKNCYQLFLDIRKQIERRRKGLFPVQPKPPQGFKDYLMNRCTYVLAGNASTRQIPSSPVPPNITPAIKELFTEQEKERHRLRLQHVIEKEKLVLSVEQEILRVHGRAARALANQSLPFSVCTILKDEEVYNLITPEQEEKDRNARSRYNGRLFLSWLQDVDDKWEKIKEAMLLRHHNEAESLHAVQKMDWEWKMKELGLCEYKSTPVIHDSHVPMVHVSDDFDLLPA